MEKVPILHHGLLAEQQFHDRPLPLQNPRSRIPRQQRRRTDRHRFKIDSESEVRGKPMHTKALKRFVTAYTHPSQAWRTSGGAPMKMTWTSSTNFKNWDFICLDENQEPVARFSSNVWAVKKIGFIEFMGDKVNDRAAREEIVVVGLTIFYTMVSRMNNILQLFGAFAAKPGYPKTENEDEDEMQTPQAVSSSRDADLDAKTAHARVTSSSSPMKPMEGQEGCDMDYGVSDGEFDTQ